MEQLKLCINCRHFSQESAASLSACHAPQNMKTDLVSGMTTTAHLPSFMRVCSIGCGEAALWFEERTA